MIPPGYREGPTVAYVPIISSLADYQRDPRVPIPIAYRRCDVGEHDRWIEAIIVRDIQGDQSC